MFYPFSDTIIPSGDRKTPNHVLPQLMLAALLLGAPPVSQSEVTIDGHRYQMTVTLTPLEGQVVTGWLAPPSDLSVVNVGTDHIKLIWRNNALNATGFAIWRQDAPNLDWHRAGGVPSTASTWTDTAVTPGTRYSYKLRANNTYAVSEFCDPISVGTNFVSHPGPTEPLLTELQTPINRLLGQAKTDDTIILLGQNFGAVPGILILGGQDVPVVSWTDNKIQAILTDFAPGSHDPLVIWRPDGHYYATRGLNIVP